MDLVDHRLGHGDKADVPARHVTIAAQEQAVEEEQAGEQLGCLRTMADLEDPPDQPHQPSTRGAVPIVQREAAQVHRQAIAQSTPLRYCY